jgi:hypothetical protein
LERLEGRVLPSDLYWIGKTNNAWSEKTNWIDESNGETPMAAPGEKDNAFVDANQYMVEKRIARTVVVDTPTTVNSLHFVQVTPDQGVAAGKLGALEILPGVSLTLESNSDIAGELEP